MESKNYRQKFDQIKTLEQRPRGFAFEKLLNEIFDDTGALINYSYKTADQSQQIDGAIELNGRVFLLEAKWENSDTLAASKLYSFLGKVNSKLEGTLGIFISYNKLKENFVNAIRDGLRQNCILIHGEDNINDIVDNKVSLDKFVWYCYREASTKNRIDVSSSEYISLPEHVVIKIQKATSPQESNWNKIYQDLTNQTEVIRFAANLQEEYEVNKEIPQKTVNIIPSLSFSPLEIEKLKILIETFLGREKEVFISALIEKFKGDYWRKYAQENIISLFPNLKFISPENSASIINNVSSNFDGDWEIENDASRVLELIFPSLTLEEKKLVALKFLPIYVDKTRRGKFEQKKFADKIFQSLKDSDINLFELFKSEILSDLSELKKIQNIWLNRGIETLETMKPSLIERMIAKYTLLFNQTNIEDVKSFLNVKYEEL